MTEKWSRLRERLADWVPPPAASVLAVMAGLAYAVAVPPLELFFLGFLAITLLQAATGELGYRQAFTTGGLAGFATHLFIYWWLIDTVVIFGNLPFAVGVLAYVLYAAGMGVYLAIVAVTVAALVRKARLMPVEAWPVAYVAVYLLLPQLFPFYLGVEFYAIKGPWRLNPPDIRVVSAMLCMVGAFLAELYRRRGNLFAEIPAWRVAGWFFAFGLMLVLSWPRSPETPAKTLRVAVVQADFPLKYALRAGDTRQRFDKFVDLYREGVEKGAELVVFSESTLPFPYIAVDDAIPPERRYGRAMTDRLNRIVVEAGVPLIASGVGFDGGRITNRSVMIEPLPDGTVRNQVYEKRRLLWFGEYVPFREHWPMHEKLFAGVAQFDPGPGPVLWTWNGLTILPSICYEAILPYFTRSIIPGNGRVDLIINMTNDKWFGITPEQEQHLMLATWRSAETGIPMIRATLNGVSAVVDGRGEILMRTGKGQSGVWMADVPLVTLAAP